MKIPYPESENLVKDYQVFDQLWAAAQDVPFQPEWANGTGYFDHLRRDSQTTTLFRTTNPETGQRVVYSIGRVLATHECRPFLIGHHFEAGSGAGSAYKAEVVQAELQDYHLQKH